MTNKKTTTGPPEARVRVGILGAGYISQAHLRALKNIPQVEATAICDLNQAKASQIARTWNVSQVFGRLEDMLDSGVDVVHVLLPPARHAEAALECLRGGADVFLEKPMGVT